MSSAFLVILTLVAMLSVPFTLRRYRMATPEQRRQILWASGGAVVVMVTLLVLASTR